jgi:hypothetical protein
MPAVILSALWFAFIAPLVTALARLPRFARRRYIVIFSIGLSIFSFVALALLVHAFLPTPRGEPPVGIVATFFGGALVGAFFGLVAGLSSAFCGERI